MFMNLKRDTTWPKNDTGRFHKLLSKTRGILGRRGSLAWGGCIKACHGIVHQRGNLSALAGTHALIDSEKEGSKLQALLKES